MMSPDDTPSKQATTQDHDNNQGSGTRKSGTSTRPPEQNLKCPRCDSPNTKFCYYNNYSLTQPRHFCKTCRRYWTKGGALRNVPIGGGCRKNKKVKSSRLSCDSKDSGSSSDLGGLKFLHSLAPPVEFQLGGGGLPFLHHHHPPITTAMYNNQFSSFGDVSATSSSVTSASTFNLDHSSGTPSSFLGLNNYPFSSSTGTGINGANAVIQGMSSLNVHSNLASSIESLSSINQDLHWKLQQQRLAMLFGGENQKESGVSQVNNLENQTQKPQPILFQNLEISKPESFPIGSSRKEGPSGGEDIPTEWFFGNSYGSVTTPTPSTTSGGGHGHDNANNWSGSGVHAWGDVQQQYSALP